MLQASGEEDDEPVVPGVELGGTSEITIGEMPQGVVDGVRLKVEDAIGRHASSPSVMRPAQQSAPRRRLTQREVTASQ